MHVKQRARYDIAVATLRGTQSLRAVDALVREMFAVAADDDHPLRLLDASVLLMYVSGACSSGVTDINAEELRATNRRLYDRVSSLLQAPTSRLSRARLLHVAGHLSLQPDLTAFDLGALDHGDETDVADLVDEDGRFEPPPLEMEDGATLPMVDRSGGMQAWLELADLLPDIPMFEVESWARVLVVMTPLLSHEPGWSALVDSVDGAVANVAGGSASASLCRDRALALMTRERHVDAIRELHKAKVGWWSGDTVRGSLLAMMLLSRSYLELGMLFAAKQHALGIASIAMNLDSEELADLIPAAVLIAADADHRAGAWCGASELYEAGLILRAHLVEHGLDLEHPSVAAAVFHLTVMIDAARVMAGPLWPLLKRIATDLGVDGVVAATLADAPERSPEDWQHEALAQGIGPPFLDAGPSRTIRFAALGTGWEIACANTVDEVRAAERLVAAAQVLLVELSHHDLALIPTSIHVDLSVASDTEGTRIVNEHDNDRRSWTVALSPVDPTDPPDLDAIGVELLTILMTILSDASLLPSEDFERVLEEAFKLGITHKLTAGRSYDELASIVSAERYDETARRELTPVSDIGFYYLPPEELGWRMGPGPTFNERTTHQLLTSRYENLVGTFDRTLESLQSSDSFRRAVTELRRRGWLDWHILTAIFNITINYRLEPTPHLDWREAVETEAAEPAPTTLFTLEAMEFARQGSMMSLIKHWGLESRQMTPNTRAIEMLLRHRYGYWNDDVDHADPFPSLPHE